MQRQQNINFQSKPEQQNLVEQEPLNIETDSEQQRQFQRIKASAKKLDLLPSWLGSTLQMLNKVNTQLKTIEIGQKHLQSQLVDLQKNRISYERLSENNQSTIQKLSKTKGYKLIEILPTFIMIQIYKYVSKEPYLWILKHRRVSPRFAFLHQYSDIVYYYSKTLLGDKYSSTFDQQNGQLQKTLMHITEQYVFFIQCFKYYKEQNYPRQLSRNSFINDLVRSLKFINKIFQLSLDQSLEYQTKINSFLLLNQGIIALQTLALMDIPVLKMNALDALVNHLGMNENLRNKNPLQGKNFQLLLSNDQIKIHLLFNIKISPFLYSQGYSYSLLKSNKKPQKLNIKNVQILLLDSSNQTIIHMMTQLQQKQNTYEIQGANPIAFSKNFVYLTYQNVNFEGIHTFAVINNQITSVYVYLKHKDCIILKET